MRSMLQRDDLEAARLFNGQASDAVNDNSALTAITVQAKPVEFTDLNFDALSVVFSHLPTMQDKLNLALANKYMSSVFLVDMAPSYFVMEILQKFLSLSSPDFNNPLTTEQRIAVKNFLSVVLTQVDAQPGFAGEEFADNWHRYRFQELHALILRRAKDPVHADVSFNNLLQLFRNFYILMLLQASNHKFNQTVVSTFLISHYGMRESKARVFGEMAVGNNSLLFAGIVSFTLFAFSCSNFNTDNNILRTGSAVLLLPSLLMLVLIKLCYKSLNYLEDIHENDLSTYRGRLLVIPADFTTNEAAALSYSAIPSQSDYNHNISLAECFPFERSHRMAEQCLFSLFADKTVETAAKTLKEELTKAAAR